MVDCLCDHRFITPGNPQANGLGERIVQVFKKASAKIGASGLPEDQWDLGVSDTLAAYRCTKQTSLKFSPYELIFGVAPTFPAPAAQRFGEFVDFDGSDEQHTRVVAELLARGAIMRRHRLVAMSNLEVAQKRDT